MATEMINSKQLRLGLPVGLTRRDEFLNQLRSRGKLTYKRYLGVALALCRRQESGGCFVVELLPAQ